MITGRTCRHCGAGISNDAPFGHCPGCLIKLGFGPVPSDFLPPDANPTSRRTFGDYELVEQIGRGGMGVVYKAWDVPLSRPVALKMILAGELASAASIERFRIEAEAAAQLEHPNIVPIYSIGEHGGNHFFSMKLVEGDSLDKLMKEFSLPHGQGAALGKAVVRQAHSAVARLMTNVARAVSYAHHRGVVHRDLKPSNILIDAEGTPFLTDFGLAKIVTRNQSVTETGAIVGSLSYMAPEQAKGQTVAKAADIYSLGAILYELLTGRPPFKAETPLETLRQVTEQEPERPVRINPLVDDDIATICLKCLEKDPQRRYSSASELAADLERWERFEPIRARPATRLVRTRRWAQRNRTAAALIITLGAAFLITAYFWQQQHTARAGAVRIATYLRQELSEEIRALEKPAIPYVELKSASLWALIKNDIPSAQRAVKATYRVGVFLDKNALPTTYKYAPLLQYLEEKMSKKLRTTLAFDVRLYRNQQAAVDDLATNDIHFLRMLPLQYVRAHARDPMIRPLVRSSNASQAVIFARRSTGIADISGLRGKTMAFGEANSTVSFLAQACLAREGLRVGDVSMSYVEQIDNEASSGARLDPEFTEFGYRSNKSAPINAVLNRGWDAGVALYNAIYSVHEGREFQQLALFTIPSSPWVAGPQVTDTLAAAFCEAMAELSESSILNLVADTGPPSLTRYVPARDNDFDQIRDSIGLVNTFFGGTNTTSVAGTSGKGL